MRLSLLTLALSLPLACAAEFALSSVWFRLEWTHSTDYDSNLVYEVWSADSPRATNWQRIAVTSTNCWPFQPTNSAQFFKVRASNMVTHLVSDWAH